MRTGSESGDQAHTNHSHTDDYNYDPKHPVWYLPATVQLDGVDDLGVGDDDHDYETAYMFNQ